MMARHYEGLSPVLEELGVGFVAFSPLANGLLSGTYGKDAAFTAEDYRAAMPQFAPEAFEANRALLRLITETARTHNATPDQLSIARMLAKRPYIIPIPGSRKPERIAENIGAAEVMLSSDEVAALDNALENMEMSAVFGGSPVKQ